MCRQPERPEEFENGQSALHLAIVLDDKAAVDVMLSRASRGFMTLINSVDENGDTPVGLAIDRQRDGLLETLAANGASFDKPCTRELDIPLHKEARRDKPKVLAFLLQSSPDWVNRCSLERPDVFRALPAGSTPLIIAAEHGSLACFRLLLGLDNADIRATRDDGIGPLIAAIMKAYLGTWLYIVI